MRICGKVLAIIFLSSASFVVTAQTKEQLRDSLKAATELLSYHPDSTDLQLRKAGWNIQLEQWEYAKNEYDKILSREPYNLSALYYRAFVNERLHRFPFARLDYQAVLTIVPGHFEAQLGLALLNEKDGRHTEALDEINVLVEAHPDSALAYAARAGIEKEQHMLSLAEYDYAQASRIDKDNVDYRLNRIELLIALNRKDEALNQLDELTKRGVAYGKLILWYKKAKGKK